MDVVCHTASGLRVAIEHRRPRGEEMGDGQGAKRDCSTTELRPDMVGATGFEPMTDNPMSSAHRNADVSDKQRTRSDLDSTVALRIELRASKREGGFAPPTYSVR